MTDNAKDSLYKCDTNFKLLLDPIYAACPVNLATFSLEINNNCTELECTVLYRTENIGQVTPDIFFFYVHVPQVFIPEYIPWDDDVP